MTESEGTDLASGEVLMDRDGVGGVTAEYDVRRSG